MDKTVVWQWPALYHIIFIRTGISLSTTVKYLNVQSRILHHWRDKEKMNLLYITGCNFTNTNLMYMFSWHWFCLVKVVWSEGTMFCVRFFRLSYRKGYQCLKHGGHSLTLIVKITLGQIWSCYIWTSIHDFLLASNSNICPKSPLEL